MDPDVTYAAIKAALHEWHNTTDVMLLITIGSSLAHNIASLDDWLERGGFPPTAWSISKPIGIVVHVAGGNAQDVYASTPQCVVEIIDEDNLKGEGFSDQEIGEHLAHMTTALYALPLE